MSIKSMTTRMLALVTVSLLLVAGGKSIESTAVADEGGACYISVIMSCCTFCAPAPAQCGDFVCYVEFVQNPIKINATLSANGKQMVGARPNTSCTYNCCSA